MSKLSNRAEQALKILAAGGQFAERLETNSFTHRTQFVIRLLAANGQIVKGFGAAAMRELTLTDRLFVAEQYSTATMFRLKDGTAERIAALRIAARGPADGFEYSGWEVHAAAAQAELDALEAPPTDPMDDFNYVGSRHHY